MVVFVFRVLIIGSSYDDVLAIGPNIVLIVEIGVELGGVFAKPIELIVVDVDVGVRLRIHPNVVLGKLFIDSSEFDEAALSIANTNIKIILLKTKNQFLSIDTYDSNLGKAILYSEKGR